MTQGKTPTTGDGLTIVRPVRRDPESGRIVPWSAYEGWKPKEAKIPFIWTIAAQAAVWAAFGLFVAALLNVGA